MIENAMTRYKAKCRQHNVTYYPADRQRADRVDYYLSMHPETSYNALAKAAIDYYLDALDSPAGKD